ncbi:MAG: type II toxin-antitoxin system PemK/MazF family toxin, partial [Acidimicrobiaceae bacterium]|nr:type II toxin-antitoxin system PemK/MazF family toxin [Acidimicrobiaceae bacterium]
MVIRRGDIHWADLRAPTGSEPGHRRPVLVVSSDRFNRSRISTVLAVAITSNLRLADAPGNVELAASESGLDRDSVVNVSQIVTVDKAAL